MLSEADYAPKVLKERRIEMASPGFRKSFMGFNRDDVTNYIEALVKKYKQSENDLLARIENLNIDLRESRERADNLQGLVNEFEAKRAEIEQLSENIGKLYLVSQANAEAIIENAKQSSTAASEEVRRNIAGIEDTHSRLEGLRNEVMEAAKRFNQEVQHLTESLDDTKSTLIMLESATDKNQATLDALMEECSEKAVKAL